jgi:hypothetical protein
MIPTNKIYRARFYLSRRNGEIFYPGNRAHAHTLIAGILRRLIAGIGAKKNGREDASSSLPLQIKPSFWGRSTVVRGLVVDGYLLFSSIICRPTMAAVVLSLFFIYSFVLNKPFGQADG